MVRVNFINRTNRKVTCFEQRWYLKEPYYSIIAFSILRPQMLIVTYKGMIYAIRFPQINIDPTRTKICTAPPVNFQPHLQSPLPYSLIRPFSAKYAKIRLDRFSLYLPSFAALK